MWSALLLCSCVVFSTAFADESLQDEPHTLLEVARHGEEPHTTKWQLLKDAKENEKNKGSVYANVPYHAEEIQSRCHRLVDQCKKQCGNDEYCRKGCEGRSGGQTTDKEKWCRTFFPTWAKLVRQPTKAEAKLECEPSCKRASAKQEKQAVCSSKCKNFWSSWETWTTMYPGMGIGAAFCGRFCGRKTTAKINGTRIKKFQQCNLGNTLWHNVMCKNYCYEEVYEDESSFCKAHKQVERELACKPLQELTAHCNGGENKCEGGTRFGLEKMQGRYCNNLCKKQDNKCVLKDAGNKIKRAMNKGVEFEVDPCPVACKVMGDECKADPQFAIDKCNADGGMIAL